MVEDDPMFYVGLIYTETLYEIKYIFRGKIKNSNGAISKQPKTIMHECIPLKKYKGKILLKNHQ